MLTFSNNQNKHLLSSSWLSPNRQVILISWLELCVSLRCTTNTLNFWINARNSDWLKALSIRNGRLGNWLFPWWFSWSRCWITFISYLFGVSLRSTTGFGVAFMPRIVRVTIPFFLGNNLLVANKTIKHIRAGYCQSHFQFNFDK